MGAIILTQIPRKTILIALLMSASMTFSTGETSAEAEPNSTLTKTMGADAQSDIIPEPVVSACYWKKVCGKWLTPHHACEYWLYKKVCDPTILIQPKRS